MGSGSRSTFLLLRCCGKGKYCWFICLFRELLTTLNILQRLTPSEKAGNEYFQIIKSFDINIAVIWFEIWPVDVERILREPSKDDQWS